MLYHWDRLDWTPHTWVNLDGGGICCWIESVCLDWFQVCNDHLAWWSGLQMGGCRLPWWHWQTRGRRAWCQWIVCHIGGWQDVGTVEICWHGHWWGLFQQWVVQDPWVELASRHTKTSMCYCLNVLTCLMRLSMNCCLGLGWGCPWDNKIWYCWSYTVLAPNWGSLGPTQYPEAMMYLMWFGPCILMMTIAQVWIDLSLCQLLMQSIFLGLQLAYLQAGNVGQLSLCWPTTTLLAWYVELLKILFVLVMIAGVVQFVLVSCIHMMSASMLRVACIRACQLMVWCALLSVLTFHDIALSQNLVLSP